MLNYSYFTIILYWDASDLSRKSLFAFLSKNRFFIRKKISCKNSFSVERNLDFSKIKVESQPNNFL